MENVYAKRWITGIILAAVILAIILFGSVEILAAVITLFIIGGVWEYNNIVFGKGFYKEKIEGLIFAFVIPLTVLLGSSQLIIAVLAFCIMIVFILLPIGTPLPVNIVRRKV